MCERMNGTVWMWSMPCCFVQSCVLPHLMLLLLQQLHFFNALSSEFRNIHMTFRMVFIDHCFCCPSDIALSSLLHNGGRIQLSPGWWHYPAFSLIMAGSFAVSLDSCQPKAALIYGTAHFSPKWNELGESRENSSSFLCLFETTLSTVKPIWLKLDFCIAGNSKRVVFSLCLSVIHHKFRLFYFQVLSSPNVKLLFYWVWNFI